MSRLARRLPNNRSTHGPRSIVLAIAIVASIGAGCLTPRADPEPDRTGEIWDDGDRGKLLTLGVFDDYNEILRGTTSTDRHLGLHYFDLKGLVSGIRCIGHGRVTQIPADSEPGVNCEGGTRNAGCAQWLATFRRLLPSFHRASSPIMQTQYQYSSLPPH